MITCTLNGKKYAVDFITGRALREMEPAAKMYSRIVALSSAALKGEPPEDAKELSIGDCYEAAEVWLNGVHIGTRIAPPYRYDISAAAKEGENTLVIEVATTLERKMKAMDDSGRPSLGGNPPVSPTGITGEVLIWCEQV